MFRPNLTCTIYKLKGHDIYGQELLAETFTERCAVVQLRKVVAPTTVRADSGASRGHGDEYNAYNKFLLTPNTVAELDDKIDISGFKLRIREMQPRYSIAGTLDHYECQGVMWS